MAVPENTLASFILGQAHLHLIRMFPHESGKGLSKTVAIYDKAESALRKNELEESISLV